MCLPFRKCDSEMCVPRGAGGWRKVAHVCVRCQLPASCLLAAGGPLPQWTVASGLLRQFAKRAARAVPRLTRISPEFHPPPLSADVPEAGPNSAAGCGRTRCLSLLGSCCAQTILDPAGHQCPPPTCVSEGFRLGRLSTRWRSGLQARQVAPLRLPGCSSPTTMLDARAARRCVLHDRTHARPQTRTHCCLSLCFSLLSCRS